MIELSHQHARRLLRKELDARLPESQWSALQLHLEGCAECRAYRAELQQAEKALQRGLRGTWEQAAPPRLHGAQLAAETKNRRRLKARVQGGLLALALLASFFGLGGPAWLGGLTRQAAEARAAGDERASAFPSPTPAPTARPGEFPAVVVYEDHSGPNAEITLLNPGALPDNLTRSSAEDTAPAWSPDGEWIAFLSDRASPRIGGQGEPKTEVFVTDLTGRRVFQLTSQPDVTWQAPLAWVPDGQSLIVAGIRDTEGGQRWLYRVDVNGAGSDPLAGTRGGSDPKVARYGGRLAYSYAENGRVGVAVYDLQSGARSLTTWPQDALAPQTQPGAAFDWSLDGGGLAYIAAVEYDQALGVPGVGVGGGAIPPSGSPSLGFASQVMAVRRMDNTAEQFFEEAAAQQVAASRWPSAFRAVSWTPSRQVIYLEDQSDARARRDSALKAECWRIQAADVASAADGAFLPGRSVFQVGALCVEGGFDRGSWTPDGGWMVVRARLPSETQAGLFAVRMVGSKIAAANGGLPLGGVVRLLEDYPSPAAAMPRVRPRLQPGETPVHIDPRAVQAAAPLLPASDLSARPDGPRGQLVYVVQNGAMSVVVVSNPDGTGGRVLYASQTKNRCPRWSPDGNQVALIAQSAQGREGLYRLQVDQVGSPRLELIYEDLRQPSRSFEPSGPRFGCPVWSAGEGAKLAATITRGQEHYLGIFDWVGAEKAAVRLAFLPGSLAAPGGARPEPAWSADGQTVYLALAPVGAHSSQVVAVRLDGAGSTLTAAPLAAKSNWGEVRGLAVIANAPYLMLAAVEQGGGGGPERFSLRQVSAAYGGLLPRAEPVPRALGLEFPAESGLAYNLAALPDNQYGLVVHGDPLLGSPQIILRYALNTRALAKLAAVQDTLRQVEWSPDGRWLVYTSEGGLYGLDVRAAAVGKARPAWISPVAVEDIDWRP